MFTVEAGLECRDRRGRHGSNLSCTWQVLEELQRFRVRHPRKTVYAVCPVGVNGAGSGLNERDGAESRPGDSREDQQGPSLPRRLWQSLALEAGVGSGEKWGEISKAKLAVLARELTSCELQVGEVSHQDRCCIGSFWWPPVR